MWKKRFIVILSLVLAGSIASENVEAGGRVQKLRPAKNPKAKKRVKTSKKVVASKLLLSKAKLLKKTYKSGHFTIAPSKKLKEIEGAYRAEMAETKGAGKGPLKGITRVHAHDIPLNLNTMSRKNLARLGREGVKELGKGKSAGAKLAKLGFNTFAPIADVTSGAGLWSRGGGEVKALIPLNIADILSTSDMRALSLAGDIVAAKTPQVARNLLGIAGEGKSDKQILSDSKSAIRNYVDAAQKSSKAINTVDVKLVSTALLSSASKSYIHFEIWTSEQTHQSIAKDLARFEAGYKTRIFHPDPVVNKKIVSAVGRYIKASKILGETHLFGYQEGVYALDPKTGKSITNSVAIGEGAGMAKAYLDKTGRTQVLEDRGATNWRFQNIEVFSALNLDLAAHLRNRTDVSVVVVPTKEGYSGGSPYIRTTNGKTSFQLLEASSIPKELGEGNAFFNTNTMVQSLSLKAPTIVGFETKGPIVRAKLNAGDITKQEGVETALFAGRIGHEYENLKSYGDFRDRAGKQLEMAQKNWE